MRTRRTRTTSTSISSATRTTSCWNERASAEAPAALYVSLYHYSFYLSNQIDGVEEDLLNKPGRPIPSGRVSLEAARRRWFVVMLLFPAAGFWLGGAPLVAWALFWQALSVLHNFLGWSKHWLTKNLVVMSLGTLAALAPAWRLSAELSGPAWRWVLLISFAVGPTICIQDLPDTDGDRAAGRKTLPIAIGEGRARVVLCACFVALPALTNVLLRRPSGLHLVAILFDALVAALCWTIDTRVVLLRSRRADHVTYMLWTGWFCAELCSALFTFRAA